VGLTHSILFDVVRVARVETALILKVSSTPLHLVLVYGMFISDLYFVCEHQGHREELELEVEPFRDLLQSFSRGLEADEFESDLGGLKRVSLL
jgi:hypothetical protein